MTVLVEVNFGVCVIGVVTVGAQSAATAQAPGVSVVIAAVLMTLPASASACSTVYEPVRVQLAPGASVAQEVLDGVSRVSLTTTLVSVALPL
ncbi:hypothetical protein VA603_18460, partial [Stenotrophomonas sp. MH1]